MTHEHIFDYKEGDIYACVADAGWITGSGNFDIILTCSVL